jgi:hypothetical protein
MMWHPVVAMQGQLRLPVICEDVSPEHDKTPALVDLGIDKQWTTFCR